MLKRTTAKLGIPIAVGALLLTGCGGGSGGDGTTYKIAYQGPLSGDNVQLGINMANGVKLAIEQANASGDYDFELEYLASDDQGLPDKAVTAAQRAIDDQDVVAVVGPAFSGPADTAAEVYAAAGMAALSPSATRADLTTKGYETFLRAVPNDSAQGTGWGKFFAEQGAKKVVVVDDKTDYGIGLADVAEQELKAKGVQTVRQSVPQKTPDYSAAARKVVGANADGLAYAGYYQDAGPFAKKLDEAGFDGIKVSGDGTRDAKFIGLAGKASEGWYLSCPCTDPAAEKATQKFAEDYQKKYNTAAGTYAAESFDATNMIIQAIADQGGEVDREALADALRKAEHKGITKTFSFDDKGEFTNQAIFMYQVKEEKIEYLGNIDELQAG